MASARYGSTDKQKLMSDEAKVRNHTSLELNDQTQTASSGTLLIDPFDPFKEKPLTEKFWIQVGFLL